MDRSDILIVRPLSLDARHAVDDGTGGHAFPVTIIAQFQKNTIHTNKDSGVHRKSETENGNKDNSTLRANSCPLDPIAGLRMSLQIGQRAVADQVALAKLRAIAPERTGFSLFKRLPSPIVAHARSAAGSSLWRTRRRRAGARYDRGRSDVISAREQPQTSSQNDGSAFGYSWHFPWYGEVSPLKTRKELVAGLLPETGAAIGAVGHLQDLRRQ
jgi:hypothetical protein